MIDRRNNRKRVVIKLGLTLNEGRQLAVGVQVLTAASAKYTNLNNVNTIVHGLLPV